MCVAVQTTQPEKSVTLDSVYIKAYAQKNFKLQLTKYKFNINLLSNIFTLSIINKKLTVIYWIKTTKINLIAE